MSAREERAHASRSESIRASNERIAVQAERYRFTTRVPMLCECSDPACRELVLIRLGGYRRTRRDTGFLTAPGHAAAGGVYPLLRSGTDDATA